LAGKSAPISADFVTIGAERNTGRDTAKNNHATAAISVATMNKNILESMRRGIVVPLCATDDRHRRIEIRYRK
jgi:hypothetical protein